MFGWIRRKKKLRKPNVDLSFLDDLSATDLLIVLSVLDILDE